MIDGADAGELQRIQQRVADLVEAGLSKRRHYLLSELGIALGPELQVLKRTSGRRLVEFISEMLGGRYEVVRSGSHENIYAVARATGHHGEHSIGDDEDRPVEDGSSSSRSVRYNYRFWAAFSVPLTSGVRLLDLDTLKFTDAERPDVVPQGSAIIEPDYITDEGVENRDQAIASQIAKWLEAHEMPQGRFLNRAPRPVRRYETDAAPRPTSVLEHVFECLDKAQLQRTTLTLDVVKALLGKTI